MKRIEKSNFRSCAWICTLTYALLLTGCDFGLDAPTEDINGIYLNTLSSVEASGDILLIQGDNAYVICGHYITSFDISDKLNPKQFPYFSDIRVINDAVAAGSYIYCACENHSLPAHELTIVDVSSPSSPSIAGSLELEYEPEGIEVDGHYAYLRAGYRLLIVDVSSPADPVLVKAVRLQNPLVDYVVENGTGYLLFLGSTLVIYDFSDPAKPLRLSQFAYYCGTILKKKGEYLYIARDSPPIIDVMKIRSTRELKSVRSVKMPNQLLDIDFDKYGVTIDNSMLYLLNISDPSFLCVAEGMIGEARSVVTRGDYIYYLSGNRFAIVKVEEIR